MDQERLGELARELKACQAASRRLTLEYVLQSGRILAEARGIAGRKFCRWVRENGRMSRITAFRHIRVAQFLGQNVSLMKHLRPLGLVKIYSLTTLPPETAARCLSGELRFTKPLTELNDVEFTREFRARFEPGARRNGAGRAFVGLMKELGRLYRLLENCDGARFTADQVRQLTQLLQGILERARRLKMVG